MNPGATEARRAHAAFTLIELLVVVAIIALLISILLPSLNQARKQARQLLGITNLRAQGQASTYYQEDNRGMIPCGIISNDEGPAGTLNGRPYIEYGTAHLMLLKYLDYTPDATVKKGQSELKNLWGFPRSEAGWERLTNAFSRMKVYQCPDYPDPDVQLDYVTNAMPVPYSKLQAEKSNDLNIGDESQGIQVDTVDYYGTRSNTFSKLVNPAKVIYITESFQTLHSDIRASGNPNAYLFNAFFIGMHLPFAGNPRIANDRRHPGGINSVFFDGHADTLPLSSLDPGWPTPLSIRLQWFAPFDRDAVDP